MENLRSPFENIFNIIGGLPQGHEKPLKHALYNALALLFLFLCCAAAWALYIILEPFIKPLIWALLVGSVLHPLKYSLATKFRSWFDKLDEARTPIVIGVFVLPINIINDVSEFIGGKLLKHIKIIIALIVTVPLIHVIYYYTPRLCICIAWKLGIYTHTTVAWLIDISTTSTIILLAIGYISILAIWWKPTTNKHFRYASILMWMVFSCYLSHLAGSFQVSVFITLQLISLGGFIFEVMNIHNEMQDAGKHITYFESALWAFENKTPEETTPTDITPDESEKSSEKSESVEEIKEKVGDGKEQDITTKKDNIWNLELFENKTQTPDNETKDNEKTITHQPVPKTRVHHLKPTRSLSHPSPMSRFRGIPQGALDRRRLSFKSHMIKNTEPLASDSYLYFLFWACGAMIFWKNISLLPLLPLPIIIYILKHVGIYLGLWQWIGSQFIKLGETIYDWCLTRCDALVPTSIRGLYKIILKINSCVKDGVRDSIDTVSSIVVILGLIVFMTCASIFFAIQIYAEAIMLVQTTGNVINSTVVHNPELRQLLPPSLDETLDSVLDNAYQYGREGISKLIRGMMNDIDSVKSAKLEQQVLELWDRVYQAWMSSNTNQGPQVTPDAVQSSWEAFLDDIKKSPEMFNIHGLIDFVKQNIGTFMSVLESLWSILKGNLTILVGSFSALVSILLGGGTAVLNFILNVIVFLTTLFYLLSSSGNLYKPVDLITNFSPYNGNRFGVALEGAVNGVFKVSLKMAVFYGLWTWFIHNLFGVKIIYLSSALATVLGAVPFLGTYWACVPAVLDLWLAQSCGFKAILLAIFQFLPSMVVDTSIYKEIKGGHPYLTGLAIAGGIFCLGFEGAIIGPLLLCGLYVVIDLSSSLFKESPSEEVAASFQMQQLSRSVQDGNSFYVECTFVGDSLDSSVVCINKENSEFDDVVLSNLMALYTDKWVRVFDIPETSKHIKGFTLYKIVSIVYPKSCPDAVTKVTVWKRYNDFKILHRELKLRHKSLQIEDKFPNLPNSSYFKRFDAEVITQRRNNILLFLEYVALHPSLFKSTEFVKFFETSHTPQESLTSNINIIRAQLNLPNDPEIIYPNSDDDQGQSDSDSVSTFSLASTSILHLDDSSVLERRSNSSHSNLNQTLESANSKVSSPDSVSNKSYRNFYPTPPSTPESTVSPQQNSPTQYLTNAAEHITKATEFESEKKYQESFAAYKNGIANLLEGVKGDKDSNRRQIVRHKIEKYLLRAEKIYNLHLSPEITQLKNICKNGIDITYSIKRPLEDLFNYKVLKIMDNGMVVLHRKEHNVFYLKVMQKSPQMSESVYLNIPKDVPYMVKLFQYYDSINAMFIVTQYVSGGKLFDQIKQKSISRSNPLTKFSSVTFEKELCDLADRDFDDISSESSECSYSDLITDYASKNSQSSSSISKNTKDPSDKNSDTEESSITSHTSDPERRDISESNSSDSVLNKSKNDIQTEVDDTVNINAQKMFQRTFSEKSYTEEFSSVSYIPPIEDIIKWSAQLLLAIDKLHKVGIVVSDLDPRNLLLDERRNLLLTFVCNFREKGKMYCHRSEYNYYCAPEVFSLQNVTFAADWWSYGAILFEILTGMPLRSVHPEGIYNYTILKIPKYVSAEGKSLLRQLLVYQPMERLGCRVNGTDDIKSHPFFSSVDWFRLQVNAFKT